MIDLDAPADSAGRRSRARIALAVAAAVVVVAVAVTGWMIATARGTEIRFEAETGSGTAMLINWNVGIEHIGRERGGALRTPWSETVTAEDLRGTAVLAVRSTDTDPVTCRIVVDGKTVAELTQDRAAGCVFSLKDLAK
jgi:hypothetical protein